MNEKQPTTNAMVQVMRSFLENASTFRAELVRKLFDPRRDIDAEAGYPQQIKDAEFRQLYDREGVARRVVDIWPDESWAVCPKVFETEDPEETIFETAWDDLVKERNAFFYLHRVDRLSGIGRFGVLLLGMDDGKPFSEPLEGIDLTTGEPTGSPGERKLLYLRAFDEHVVQIDSRVGDQTSPRFGQPERYTIKFIDHGTLGSIGSPTKSTRQQSVTVHWTRVIHVADNRETSEVFGVSRLQTPFNRLLDLRKVLSGSGEMFWKGAFPGYALETDPSIPDAEIDAVTIRRQLDDHFNGLQRYLALTGISVKSLAPQVSDPGPHVAVFMESLAVTIGIPKRKFLGSEQAQLASSQDSRTWNTRVAKRQEIYLSPMLIRPFVDRLIAVGVLPEPESYDVTWPDLNTITDEEKAEVGKIRTEALAKYVQGGVEEIIPPEEFLKLIMEMDPEEIEQIMKASEAFQDDLDERAIEVEGARLAEEDRLNAEADRVRELEAAARTE